MILALVLGVASAALGADGDFFKVGRNNLASAISTLTKNGAGPALKLNVDSGAPLAVNSDKMVRNLNADKLDGMHASQLAPRGYAQVTVHQSDFLEAGSKGVIRVERNAQNVYCFQLSFEPNAAVASPNVNNNATVGTVVGSAADSKCGGTSFEAAAATYAANADPSPARNDINFGIAFM